MFIDAESLEEEEEEEDIYISCTGSQPPLSRSIINPGQTSIFKLWQPTFLHHFGSHHSPTNLVIGLLS
jgi:hypothetical protein